MKSIGFWGVVSIIAAFILVYNFLGFLSGSFNRGYDNQQYYQNNVQSVHLGVLNPQNIEYSNHESNRYPVSDYQNGYSYRATDSYQNQISYEEDYGSNYHEDFSNYNYYSNVHEYHQNIPSYYPVLNDAMRTVEYHECYTSPPRNQLLYVRCPGY